MLIALEWDAQTNGKKGITPATMPLMTLASTAIDQIRVDKEFVQNTVLSYLPSDTALYFAPSEQRILFEAQQKHLSPLISWLEAEFKFHLAVTVGSHQRITHPPSVSACIKEMVEVLVLRIS